MYFKEELQGEARDTYGSVFLSSRGLPKPDSDTGLAFSSTGTSYLLSTDLCQTKENVNQSIV